MQINKTMFSSSSTISAVSSMQDKMSQLQIQLATGKRANSLSELGSARSFDLTIRSRMSKIESYQTNIDTVNLRLDFYDNVLQRLDQIEADARSSVATGAGPDGINMATAQTTARARLDEVLTLLNTDLNGRHLFGGNQTETNPVEGYDVAINGDVTRDGFKTVSTEFKAAHLGADGKGRLVSDISTLTSAVGGTANVIAVSEKDGVLFPNGSTIGVVSTTSAGSIAVTAAAGAPPSSDITFTNAPTAPVDGEQITINVTTGDGNAVAHTFTAVTGTPANANEFQIDANPDTTAANFKAAFDTALASDTLTLAEDGTTTHRFGMKLKSVSSDSANIATTTPTGTPPVEGLRLTGLPTAGEKITFELIMPDQSVSTIELEAVTGTPSDPGQFQIGADISSTLTNIKTALDSELVRKGSTELTSAAAYDAADNFFNGRGESVMRVDGPPFDSATVLKTASSTDTVFWYTGEDATGSARQTVSAQVDDATRVNYGVQGNESGMTALVRSLAVLSGETFSTSDADSEDRFKSIVKGQLSRLSESNNATDGSIEIIALELGIARSTLGATSERHDNYNVQLDNMLADIEHAPIEEVAVQMLALKTQIEASFQTMSMVSQLTLVNFI